MRSLPAHLDTTVTGGAGDPRRASFARDHRRWQISVIVIVVFALSACSQPMTVDEAVDSFQTAHPQASTIEAECVVEDLVAAIEPDPDAALESGEVPGLEAELLREPHTTSFDLQQARAMFRCGLRDDLETQLATQLDAAGLDPDRTDCVAAELVPNLTEDDFDVLLGSAMTDEFFERMFDAAEACDALPT